MNRYLSAFRIAAIGGALIGALVGLRQWSWVWPGLALEAAARPIAIGWLVGVVLSPALARARPRRTAGEPKAPPARWRRAASLLLTVLALAPVALWPSLARPAAPLRGAPQPTGPQGDTRPNLIFITIDALRTDHVGVYGSDLGLTPSLDAFAEEATQYQSAHVSAPWTLPSFGVMFTSRFPSECGLKSGDANLTDWYLGEAVLSDDVRVLPEQLRDAGYVTAAEVTNPFLAAERGWRRGFDYFRNEDGADIGSLRTDARTVTQHTLSWVRLNRRQPFFLWVHYIDPHAPYESPDAPPELVSRKMPEWGLDRAYWYGRMEYASEAEQSQFQEFCRLMYAEEVRFADRWVGELLAGLRQAGLWERSLIVISADHGEEFWEHGGFEHGHTMYEELLSVPLLVKWPSGVEADPEVTQDVGLIDLAPTFLEFAGAPPMDDMRGQPLERRDGSSDREFYCEANLYYDQQTALITRDYKVIYHPHSLWRALDYEVYDRRQDPAELDNQAALPEVAELCVRLAEQTTQAHTIASQWEATGQRRFQLDESVRRRLESLGYVGD